MLARNIAKTMTDKKSLNAVKVQKLLFYGQALSLNILGTVLFDDDIEVWENGPVVRDVFRLYRDNSLKYINSVDKNDTDRHLIIDITLQYFGSKSGTKLIALTHQDGGAWKRVVEEKHIKDFLLDNEIIPLPYIEEEMKLFPKIIQELHAPAKIDKKYLYKNINDIAEKLR